MAYELQFAGDYSLENILVYGASTQGELDIKPLLMELNIYESIFTPNISGSLTIVDSANHLQNVPFKGQEELEFKFGIPGKDNEMIDFTKHRVRITKVSNVVRTQERQQVYTLNFTSRETLTDLRTSLHKKFSGSANEIIIDVLKNSIKTDKLFRIEDATETLTLTGNRMKPFKFCNMVANMGSSKIENDDKLYFYENHRGYNLSSLSKLAKGEPKFVFYKSEGRGERKDTKADMEKILNYRVTKNQDLLIHIATGLINSTQYTYDINTKSFNKTEHRYFDKFTTTPHTADKPFPIYTTQPESGDGKLLDDFTSSVTKVSTKNSLLHTIDGDDTSDYSNTTSKDQSRLYSRLNYDALTVNVSVPGNSNIAAGDTVELNLPSLEPVNKSFDNTYDIFQSGKYIVTNVVHTVSPTNYVTTFDCCKDSVNNAYQTSSEPINKKVIL